MTIASDPRIIAVFGSPPSGIDFSANRVFENNTAVCVLLGLATTAVILRFIARIILRNNLMADDWSIILALLCVGATTGLSIAGGTFGAGKHVWAVTLPDLIQIFKILYAYTFLYAATCSATKMSIIFFYRRLFMPLARGRSLRWSIIFCSVLALSYPITVWVTMGNCCRPVSFYWTQFSGTKGECIDVKTFFLALGIINMLNDIIILAVGFPPVLKLQMSNRKKAAVCGILLLGSFVCVASIVRVYYLSEFTKAIDVTWLMGPVFIWSTIEPSIGIVCACLPHLAPLVKLARKNISSSFNRTSEPPYPSTQWRSRSGPAQSLQKGILPLFTFRDKISRAELDDEIGLTNQVTTGLHTRKANSFESHSDENLQNHTIVVQSSIVQSISQK